MKKLNSSIIYIIFVFLFTAHSVKSQTPSQLDTTFAPIIEVLVGSVYTTAKQPDGKILVGGVFATATGTERWGIARYNANGTLDTSFNATLAITANGIRSVIVLPDGKILVGGHFASASSPTGAKNITRLNPDGSEDTTFTGYTNGVILAAATQPDGKIIIGGTFTNVNGQSRIGTARLNSDGTTDASYTFSASNVFSIAVQPDGKILFGGNFNFSSPVSISRIARVSSTGEVDSSFVANASANSTVRAIKIQSDGKIVIGGSFNTVSGTSRTNLARLNSDGTLDTAFNPTITSAATTSVDGIDFDANGKIIFGGAFTTVNGANRQNIARLNSDGTLDSSFAPQSGANLPVRSILAESDGNLLIGGDFQRFNGLSKYRIVRLNNDGSVNSNFNVVLYAPSTTYDVDIQPDGKIITAGAFTYVNGVTTGTVARFNVDGTLDSSFATSQIFGSDVYDIEIQPDGKIILVGGFYIGSNQDYHSIVRLNSDGTVDNSFPPLKITTGDVYRAKIQADGKILIAGSFTNVTNTTRRGLARLNPNGTLDTGFNSSLTVPVQSASALDIAIKSDGKIIVGGYFSAVNGTAKNNIAQLNSDGTLDTSFTAEASNPVNSIALLQDGKLLIAGNFTSINGTNANRIAKLLSNGQLDTSFNVDPTFNFPSFVIKPYIDGRIIVAGQNRYVNNLQNYVVILNANGSTNAALPNSQWFNYSVSDFEISSDGKVVFCGSFTRVGGATRLGLARLNSIDFTPDTPNKPIFDFDGDGKTDISIFRPTTGAWWLNASSTNVTTAVGFGASDDKLTPADYTGDGKTDLAFFRPSNSTWYILRSEDYSFYGFQFGAPGDIPAPGDFDGDGKTDAAVFRPSTASWYILRSSDGAVTSLQFGVAEDKPVVVDYDGDGKDDIGIFRPTPSEWWILKSTGGVFSVQFGQTGDKAVPGDYTGDGKADIAFWRPSSGTWYILRSEDNSFYGFPFGNSSDTPTPGDYDGDGKMDAAVFRDSNASWYLLRSTAGFTGIAFGNSNDRPIPNAFVR